VALDPFGTAELRRRVLDAWRESPARFRADANVEDDLALTGYRDRVVVELAQNAADAATRAGVAGRLILRLAGETLTAANTGAPLDAAGVESIAVARASSKVDLVGAVGRFGVGFAAVLAVCDAPSIASASGAVRWSRTDARAAAAAVEALAEELTSRGDRVPVLRLPFADASQPLPLPGFETTVTLPLRDAEAVDAVRAQLVALEPTVLLALPALAEIIVVVDDDEHVLRADHDGDIAMLHDGAAATRWRIIAGSGPLPLELLADRPIEEQRVDTWQVSWALPIDAEGHLVELPDTTDRVVRAPTAVDDRLTVPAVLIASYPLDSARRRVTPGPLTGAVTAHAATVLAEFLRDASPDPSFGRLVPTGFPDGEIDGALHAALLEALSETAWLPVVSDPDRRERPREATAVPDELVDVLSAVVPSLLPAGWSQPGLVALGVRRPTVADLVEALASVNQEPAWWRSLYAALDKAVPAGPDRDALGALPVPLADGSVAIGPRGLALPAAGLPDVDLVAIGVRLVHPDAAHPLLRGFGAVDGTPRELLDQPHVEAAVAASYDEDNPAPIAAAVLSLLAATGADAAELPWLADLALPDDAGEWRPAGELVVPDGLMASVIAEDSAFGVVTRDWLDRYGVVTMVAVGVLDGPALFQERDAVAPTHDLDDEASWWAFLPPDSAVEDFVAVRDLEQIRAAALPEVLAALAAPPLRAAIVEPAEVTLADGGRLRVPSYTGWWLSSRPVLDGRVPRDLRLADSDPVLDGLYDVAPASFDREFLSALGVLRSLPDADPDDVLRRMRDPQRVVTRTQLRALDGWLADQPVDPPERVRAVRDGDVVVVDAVDAVIVDAPDLLPLLADLAVVPVTTARAARLAERLDLPLASGLAEFAVVSEGSLLDDAVVHDVLRVVDVDGRHREVAWRLVEGTLHVDARRLSWGLGRGRAWRDGEWSQRHRRSEALNQPEMGMMRDSEDDLDPDPEE
jgi:hypothetical protein